jgi:hypothetical protein
MVLVQYEGRTVILIERKKAAEEGATEQAIA